MLVSGADIISDKLSADVFSLPAHWFQNNLRDLFSATAFRKAWRRS